MKRKSIKDNKIKDLLPDQKGIALLTTLIFIFILVTFAVALLAMTSNDIKLSALQRDSTKAFYIAESGIEKALWYLNTTSEGGKGFGWRGTFNEGTTAEYYDVTVETVQDETPIAPEIIKISSTGVVKPVGVKNSRKRKIEVKAKKGVLQVDNLSYKYAIDTDTSMVLKGNIGITGDIHSNGTIGVEGGAYTLNGNSYAVGVNEAVGQDNESHSGEENYEEHPQVDFNFYRALVDRVFDDGEEYGGYYENMNGGTFYFGTD